MDERSISIIVDEVVRKLKEGGLAPGGATTAQAAGPKNSTGLHGVFSTIDEAAEAAHAAFQKYRYSSLETRKAIINAIRVTSHKYKEDFSKRILDETKLGRISHKLTKHEAVADGTPGVEDLVTRCWSGDRGLTIEEYAPFGVIGAVTPTTHPVETLINNSIMFLSGGNTAVFNPHPASKRCFAYALDVFNNVIKSVSGFSNLITCIDEPTIDTGKQMFNHPKVKLLLVTGGGAVVKEALKTPKKAITAGPGNPPVVVDESAVLPQAARDIILGAGFDNNILCIGEKEVFVVESVADKLIAELKKQGCYELSPKQIDELARLAFGVKDGDPRSAKSCSGVMLNRDMVGRDASVLAKMIGVDVPGDPPLLIGETEFDHLWVQQEQMMPFLPIVRCRDVDEAIDMAVKAEHGYRHTAVIHSLNVGSMTKMGRAMDCSIFVKNGPSYAGLGCGGEGHTSFSIASPTGEGITTPRTFCRIRRCALIDYLRIV